MLLGVQDSVLDTYLLQLLREHLRRRDRNRAHENGLARFVPRLKFLDRRVEFLVFRFKDNVRLIDAQKRPIRRNQSHVEVVDLCELFGFGIRGTRHAGELVVHAEIVLEGDRREGLALAANLDAFFCFDRLMKTVGPAATGHQSPRMLIDDHDFLLAIIARTNDIVDVDILKRVRHQSLLHSVQDG